MDFDAEWKHLQVRRARPDDSTHWDTKSARYDSKDSKNLYAMEFVSRMELDPADTIFDMGCGTGPLSMLLAEAGHDVLAADFSAGMLDKFHQNLAQHNPNAKVETLHMSWEDDWSAFGITDQMVDVAVASRSISSFDLRLCLEKLTRIARKRVYITITTGTSPKVDPVLLRELGITVHQDCDYLYAFGLLAQAGLEPSVSYIRSPRKDTWASPEAAFEDLSVMIPLAAPDFSEAQLAEAHQQLKAWLDQHLVANPEAGMRDRKGFVQGPLTLDRMRIVPWAFISWDASPQGADALATLATTENIQRPTPRERTHSCN